MSETKPTAPRPRVLLVGPWPPTKGGVTTFMQNLASDPELAQRYAFHAYSTSRPPKEDTTENWGYHALFAGGLWRAAVAAWVSLWHMIVFPLRVVRWRIDIVQVMASDFLVFWESVAYVLVAKALRRATVLRLGGAFDRFWDASGPRARRWIAWGIGLPDRLIVQSDYWVGVAATAGRTSGVVVVNNWVGDDLPNPAPRPVRPVPELLFIAGNEATRKGVDTLLAALDQLYRGTIDFRLTMVAVPGPLRTRVTTLPWAERISCHGFVERAAVLALMDQADVFVLPSRGEGFPNSLVEAMARGCAAIATPVGAVPEVMEHGVSGMIVPVDQPDSLAATLTQLVAAPDLRRALATAAVARVTSRFTASAIRAVIDGLYQPLLTRR